MTKTKIIWFKIIFEKKSHNDFKPFIFEYCLNIKMPEEKDFELIQEFIAGSEQAFNRIAVKYREKIYWQARRMIGNHLDADEVTQEVLLVIYEKLKDFKFNAALYTWIYKITATRSINKINANRVRRFFSLEDAETKNNYKNDIVQNIEDKEKLKRLDGVLQKLPVKQREVFILRNFEELSYEEISQITGKSTGALKANYFHALKKVTELMNENE